MCFVNSNCTIIASCLVLLALWRVAKESISPSPHVPSLSFIYIYIKIMSIALIFINVTVLCYLLLYCLCYYLMLYYYYFLLNHKVGFKNSYFLLKLLATTVLSQKLQLSNLKQIGSPLYNSYTNFYFPPELPQIMIALH